MNGRDSLLSAVELPPSVQATLGRLNPRDDNRDYRWSEPSLLNVTPLISNSWFMGCPKTFPLAASHTCAVAPSLHPTIR